MFSAFFSFRSIIYTLLFCAGLISVIFTVHILAVYILFRWFTRIQYMEGIVIFNQCVAKEMDDRPGMYELFQSSCDLTCRDEVRGNNNNSTTADHHSAHPAHASNPTSANSVSPQSSAYSNFTTVFPTIPLLWNTNVGSSSHNHLLRLVRGGTVHQQSCESKHTHSSWCSTTDLPSSHTDQSHQLHPSSQEGNLRNSVHYRDVAQPAVRPLLQQTRITNATEATASMTHAFVPLPLSTVATVMASRPCEDEASRNNSREPNGDNRTVGMHPLHKRPDATAGKVNQNMIPGTLSHPHQHQEGESSESHGIEHAPMCWMRDCSIPVLPSPCRATHIPDTQGHVGLIQHECCHRSCAHLSSPAVCDKVRGDALDGMCGVSGVTAVAIHDHQSNMNNTHHSGSSLNYANNDSVNSTNRRTHVTHNPIHPADLTQSIMIDPSCNEIEHAEQIAPVPVDVGLIPTEWPPLRGFAMNFICADAVDGRLRPHRHFASVRQTRKQRNAKLRARYCRHFGSYDGLTFSMWGRPLSDLFDPLRLRLFAAFHTYEADEPAEGWLLCGGRSVRPARCNSHNIVALSSPSAHLDDVYSIHGHELGTIMYRPGDRVDDWKVIKKRSAAASAATSAAHANVTDACERAEVAESAAPGCSVEMHDLITGERFYPVNMHIFFNPYLSGFYSDPNAPWTWGEHPSYLPRSACALPDFELVHENNAVAC